MMPSPQTTPARRQQALGAALDHLRNGRFDPAADLCRTLLAGDPHDVDARFLLGVAEGARGNAQAALDHLSAVVETRPGHVDARGELARLYQSLGRVDDAEKQFRAILRRMPGDVAALCAYGRFLLETGRAADAAGQAEAALAAAPNSSPALNLLGMGLAAQGRLDEAIATFGRAAAADRMNASAYANLANALSVEGRFAQSLAASGEALRLAPQDLTIRINHAVALLKSGRLLEGWSEYEWRHRQPGREKLPPALMLPKLAHLGGVQGRTVLIYHEEGFGDTLQFLRYAPMLAERGARVIAWMPAELVRLVRGQAGIAEALTGNVTLPRFDFHCPIISLPHVFDTGLETVPAKIPYIAADPALAEAWAVRLPVAPLRVGLVWAGEPRAYDPAALALDRRRSLDFVALAPVLAAPGATFVSLQTGAAAEQAGGAIHDPMRGVRDFADTAAIIASLDLVVSVDTAVAHLAGGMGKPVFLLDRYDNCWRWLTRRNDSPWYPTMRIFRQARMGEWEPAIHEVAEAVRGLVGGR
jgi:tetratricopeptide (TPR) repeat protein